jgi:type I restriction enzyme S subunit
VLKSAFEGKLTEQWRRTHRDELEPASKLLEQIKAERRKGWENNLRAKGKDPKKCKSGAPEPVRLENLKPVPEGWVWSSIDEIFQVGSGGTPRRDKPEYWNGGIPWVSSGEVAFCEVSRTKGQISELGMQNSSARMYPPGTVLLALYGEGRTRGQAAILRIHASTNQAIAAILCTDSFIPSEYVYWWLCQRYEETRRTASGANQPNMYLRNVRMIPIPLAPLNEIIQIVSKIQQLLSSTEGTEKSIDAARPLTDSLRQSILRKAFRGGLMPQDPSDEPASVLLDRIRKSFKAQMIQDQKSERGKSR